MGNSLEKYNTCADQIYIGSDKQVNLLLRNHNFAAGINKPTEISYKVIVNPNEEDRYKGDFWGDKGYSIYQTISYASIAIEFITDTIFKSRYDSDDQPIPDKRYIPEYISGFENRDAYHLYEGNYDNSDAQMGYVLEARLENIKRKLSEFEDNDSKLDILLDGVLIDSTIKDQLERFKWMSSLNSVFDLVQPYPTYPAYNKEYLFETPRSNTEMDKKQIEKINSIINHVFNSASRVANIKFIPANNATIELKFKTYIGENKDFNKHINGDFRYDQGGIREGGGEDFHYNNGKTIYAEYVARYYISDHFLSELTWKDIFHELSHLFIDHPNDSVFAPDYNLNDQTIEEKDFSNEYRADSGCMSVMAFNECSYNGKSLQPISYLPIDILAMQHIYSANKDTEAGNTKYIFTDKQVYINNINSPMFPMDMPIDAIYTLYDAGGINTLDLTLVTTPVVIDLNPGASHFNKVGEGIFLIDYNTHIHNVITGSTNTSIILNLNESNKIFIPPKGAHVTIENISANDKIILNAEANENISAIKGCIKPYSESGDLETEICVTGSSIDVIIGAFDFN